ncbi:MAG TPA: thiamine phosphate synthase [Nitrospiraceae bacterium]|nr:thiamine phosphate synthase [Nitrospiraceae bacterium]HCZ10746.1 thiamine phosphate synthase [Nitrospiraceae bacterium]
MDFKLYLITDRKLFADSGLMFAAVEEALKAGVRAVQLREKDLPTRELLYMAYKMRGLTAKYSAGFFINDRVDIALCVDADGVHLGQNSIPAYAVRKAVNASRITHHASRFLIGVSTHNSEEAVIAEMEGADFVTFGPIYHTPSKLKYGEPVGLESLKKVKEKISIPIFGIGGIKSDNAKEVIDAGAYGAAVISGILIEADTASAAEKYLKILGT